MTTNNGNLKSHLESLYHLYNHTYLASDPVRFVHRYEGKENREIVGLVAAALAYGNVKQINASIEKALEPLGVSPVDYIRALNPGSLLEQYTGFVHRFNNGRDLSLLVYFLHQVFNRYSSLEEFFMVGYSEGDATIERSLTSFVSRLFELDCSLFYKEGLPQTAGVRFFLSSPAHKSACKRMNMFLRWMVRSDDGVDCGLWNQVNPSQLVMPLDAHTARISRYIGLTDKRTTSWSMALEVTENLRKIDPYDPVKYDFAMSRLGILDKCMHRYVKDLCEQCSLFNVCSLGRNGRRS